MHRPTSCALLASASSHKTGEGQVTCWYWWGKASCLKNRTAFYQLALPRNSEKLMAKQGNLLAASYLLACLTSLLASCKLALSDNYDKF